MNKEELKEALREFEEERSRGHALAFLLVIGIVLFVFAISWPMAWVQSRIYHTIHLDIQPPQECDQSAPFESQSNCFWPYTANPRITNDW